LHFVPAVDQDGNEVSGVHLPDLIVPLATYTGWNLRLTQDEFSESGCRI
jgi:hypothetical protein